MKNIIKKLIFNRGRSGSDLCIEYIINFINKYFKKFKNIRRYYKMINKNITYCGLYCENCYQRTNIGPESKKLFESLKKLGYEQFIDKIPRFSDFWDYLSELAITNGCRGCREAGGNSYCKIRTCAQEKRVKICSLCNEYPCEEYKNIISVYPMLKEDNLYLKKYGLRAWLKMQKKRRLLGYTYTDARRKE